ncbi:MAG: universal stress protein UspA [Polaromonas sp.]|jgi:nucleotide-binding universal stress UspA family protein|nr:universal stress protein UspA [Polaromonas sp.]
MKILVPVDGSQYTQRMLDYIERHEELFGPSHQYTLCTVVPPVTSRASSFLSHENVESYYQDEAATVLRPLQAFIEQPGWSVKAMHLVGSPAAAIAELAGKEGFDLIVMGTHGHTVFGSVVMGSVTTGVIGRCKLPVLLIQ